jgi:hypothetical protein
VPSTSKRPCLDYLQRHPTLLNSLLTCSSTRPSTSGRDHTRTCWTNARAVSAASPAAVDDVRGFTVFTAFHAYGGGTGVAKDIEVSAHYGHEGGVDNQVDWQLSWFVECFPDQG